MSAQIAERILWMSVGVASGPIILFQTFGLSPTNGQLVTATACAMLAIVALRIYSARGEVNGSQ